MKERERALLSSSSSSSYSAASALAAWSKKTMLLLLCVPTHSPTIASGAAAWRWLPLVGLVFEAEGEEGREEVALGEEKTS